MSEDPIGEEVRRMAQGQHDRLSALLAEFVQECGPIDPQVMEEVRREWLAPKKKAATLGIT